MPKVSICIPTYNQVKFLKKTIDSILVQSYKDYEIIVSDDSTTSNVRLFLNSYDFNGKLRYFKNDRSLGSPKNWNACLSKANGELIKFLHHDDFFTANDSLEKMVSLMDDVSVDFAFCGCNNMLYDGQHLFYHAITTDESKTLKQTPEYLYYRNCIGAPSVTIYRKNSLAFDENITYLVDIEFYIRLLKLNRNFNYSSEFLITCSETEDRITNSYINNKGFLLYEYAYTFNTIAFTVTNFKWIYLSFWQLFRNLKIATHKDLQKFNFLKGCPGFIKTLLVLKPKTIIYRSGLINRFFKYLVFIPVSISFAFSRFRKTNMLFSITRNTDLS